MVRLHSFAQFPMDHFSYPVMPAPEFLLCWFAAFAYYVINCFISLQIAYTRCSMYYRFSAFILLQFNSPFIVQLCTQSWRWFGHFTRDSLHSHPWLLCEAAHGTHKLHYTIFEISSYNLMYIVFSQNVESLFSHFFGTIPRALTTICILVTFIFHRSLARSWYFHSMVNCKGKIHKLTSSFILVN